MQNLAYIIFNRRKKNLIIILFFKNEVSKNNSTNFVAFWTQEMGFFFGNFFFGDF